MKKEAGFTLIELLLVLAIIGIISAIAIPALLGQRERAKAKAVQENTVAIAGECARINDQARELGTALTPTQVATSVILLSNYATAKNPYTGSGSSYVVSAAGSTAGTVYLTAGPVIDAANPTLSYNAVTITGVYLQGGTPTSMAKIVALD